MIDETLSQLLYQCSKDFDPITLLVTADRANEVNEPQLEWLLRWLPTYNHRGLLFTGSRRYGLPREDSDWDWVISINNKVFDCGPYYSEIWKVSNLLDNNCNTINSWYRYGKTDRIYTGDGATDYCTRFGPINLIVVSTQLQWDSWVTATNDIIKHQNITNEPLTKEFAKQHSRQVWMDLCRQEGVMDGFM